MRSADKYLPRHIVVSTSSIAETITWPCPSQDCQLISRMENSIAIIRSNGRNGSMQRAFIVSVEMVRPLVSGYLAESISRSFLCVTGSSCLRQRSFMRGYLSMSRASSQRRGFPRNFGFKAMADAVHTGHTTTNPIMAENTTDVGVASGSRPEKTSKMNFLKAVVKKLKRGGSVIRFIPFRSSSDGWISFRDYESRLDDHQTKSETNVQVESITPYSEARGSAYRIRFDETRLDQLPSLEQGHVRKIVASLEVKLATAQITEQDLTVKDISAADTSNDMERTVGCTKGEEGSIGAKVPKDVVQDISSFHPLHFSSNIPNSKGTLNLQKPVAVVKQPADLIASRKTSMRADNRGSGEEDVSASISPHGFEMYAPDTEVAQEAGTKDAPSETPGIGSDSDMKKISVEKNPKQTHRHRRRLHISKRDKKDKPLREEKSYEVGDTIEMRPSPTGGSVKQGDIIDKESKEVKATGTEVSFLDTPDTHELNKMAHANELDREPPQHSAVTHHVVNETADQDTSHEGEEHMSTTESARSNGRNRRHKKRLLGLLIPSFYRA